MQHVIHTIPPIVSSRSKTLLLGTMPSPKSREAAFYYAHPQNRFWRALALALDQPTPCSIEEKTALILNHDLALWDVLKSCEIVGASDASIRDPVANDIAALLTFAHISRVFCTGATATRLYRQLVEPEIGLSCTALPSPSAANARCSLPALAAAYRAALLG